MQSLIPTLTVPDIDAAIKFYADVLGFEPSYSLPGPDGRIIHGSAQRGSVSLMFSVPYGDDAHEQPPYGNGVSLYTTINDDEDVDALYQHARDNGATILWEPTDQFWGHRDWGLVDPNGYVTIVSKVVKEATEEDMRKGAEAMAGVAV
jgi:PhnB protein